MRNYEPRYNIGSGEYESSSDPMERNDEMMSRKISQNLVDKRLKRESRSSEPQKRKVYRYCADLFTFCGYVIIAPIAGQPGQCMLLCTSKHNTAANKKFRSNSCP